MATGDNRIEERINANLLARLRGGGSDRDVSLLDLSSRGFMASASPSPPRGAIVELIVGRHSLVGQVQWSGERRFGVRLRDRIDVIAVLGNEAGPTVLKRAQVARGRPSVAAQLAFSRHVARGFVMGILISVAVLCAIVAFQAVRQSLAPLEEAGSSLANVPVR